MVDCERASALECLEYFKRRYRRRVDSLSLGAYKLPQASCPYIDPLMPFLLQDKVFYQGRAFVSDELKPLGGNECTIDLMGLAWEMLGTTPTEFLQFQRSISSPWSPFLQTFAAHARTLLGGCTHTKKSEIHFSVRDLEVFLWKSGLSSNDREAFNLQHWTIRNYKILLQDMQLGPLPWTYVVKHSVNCIIGGMFGQKPREHPIIYPMEHGLMLYMEQQWPRLAGVYLDDALSIMPETTVEQTAEPSSAIWSQAWDNQVFDTDEEKEVPLVVHVLFSAAGTGKTRQIFDLLSKHWGFYFLPPGLMPTDTSTVTTLTTDAADILAPQRYFASRDTYTMRQDYAGNDLDNISTSNVFQPLFASRVVLLYELLCRRSRTTPQEWLLLQISCTTFDAFDAMSRLFRLARVGFSDTDYSESPEFGTPGEVFQKLQTLLENRNLFFDGRLYFCMDETQVALEDPNAHQLFEHWYNALTNSYVFSWVHQPAPNRDLMVDEAASRTDDGSESSGLAVSWRRGDRIRLIDPILVFSGTALNMQSLRAALNRVSRDTWKGEETPRKWLGELVHHIFHLVTTDEDFWGVYESHLTGIIGEQARGSDPRDDPVCSLPLLSRSGRPLSFENFQGGLDNLMASWLWAPIDCLSLSGFLRLMIGVCTPLNITGDLPLPEDDLDFAEDLSAFLDQADPLSVTAVLSRLITPTNQGTKAKPTSITSLVLGTLSKHAGISKEEVLSMVSQCYAESPTIQANTAGSVVMLYHQLRVIHVRVMITESSRIFRGRYRWSTTFIESLLSQAGEAPEVIQDITLCTIRDMVAQARVTTYASSTGALLRQIRRLRESDRGSLVQDLYRAAIRSHIMGRPHIWLQQQYAELVTYGFALVHRIDETTVRYKLAEPIAVHAVMDFLHQEGQEEYKEVMLGSLIHTQDDYDVQAMFGRATEWFIAAVCQLLTEVKDCLRILLTGFRGLSGI